MLFRSIVPTVNDAALIPDVGTADDGKEPTESAEALMPDVVDVVITVPDSAGNVCVNVEPVEGALSVIEPPPDEFIVIGISRIYPLCSKCA